MSGPKRELFPGFHQSLATAVMAWHRAKANLMEATMGVKEAERQLRLLSVDPNQSWALDEAMNATEVFRCARDGCDRPSIPTWSNKSRVYCPEHEAEESESKVVVKAIDLPKKEAASDDHPF